MVLQRRCERCGRGPFSVDQSGWLHRHLNSKGKPCGSSPPRPLTYDEKLANAATALRNLAHLEPTGEHAVEFLHLANNLEWRRLELANEVEKQTQN